MKTYKVNISMDIPEELLTDLISIFRQRKEPEQETKDIKPTENKKRQKAGLKDAAEALGLSEWAVRIKCKSGELPYVMSGNRYILDIEQCQKILDQQALNNMKKEEPQTGIIRRIKE